MENKDNILVAVISNVHGIKGEVKVKSFTEPSDNFASYCPLTDKNGEKFDIKILSDAGGGIFRCKVEGINSRDDAENIKGIELFIKKSALPLLDDEDEFYHEDLIDCKITFLNGEKIGYVSSVHNFGAGDILEIKTFEGKSILIPFTKAFVPFVDVKNKVIKVEKALGLFDDYNDSDNKSDEDKGI